ncbi:MAG: hypothetical protein CL943_00110 [Candidatus Diapherotrites archaeon]|uniref:Aminopeptidase P family protein n=1 Tax=Candidatus Iainarchaeum sp. TaxID=3101447 RepID=A0A2D6LZV1_9ARCH|nr:hypothetical protein [Candidatus Diapherotrites archaeon]
MMRERIKELFGKTKVDAIALRTFPNNPDASFPYFSGLPSGFLTNNFLLLGKKKKPLVVRTVLDPEVKGKKLRIKTVKKRKEMESLLKKELKGKKIGVNKSIYTISSFKALQKALPKKRFVDISEQLMETRNIKSNAEIEKIAKAAKITEKVLRKVPRLFRKGITEKQLALKIEILLREQTGESLAFPVIVANGRNSTFPHHVPSDKKIRKGLILIDCGARYKGYCGDLTRMFSVGRPTKQEQKVYSAVFEAKKIGEELSVEGASASQIFKKVSSFLKKSTGQKLVHGLGHGLGLETHDAPCGFLPDSKTVLGRNMVLTVEPAVYLKGFGIRIEDDIVVKTGKCRKLSNAPKALISL